MDEENIPQTARSESAFSGTSDARRNPNLPFEVQAKAYLIRATGKLRFDLWKPSLEKRSGVTFENGRMYVIGGTVKGMMFESRHMSSGNLHVYVFVDGGAGMAPGEACTLLVETLEERRRFEVLLGKRGPVVRLTRSLLEGLGIPTGESTMVELVVRKPGELTRKVYSRWDPFLGFMELQLGGAGFAAGDTLEVVDGRQYDVGQFVEDFRAHRLGELANVELGLEGGSLTAVVDGKRIPVERHWMATHGLKAALKVELGYEHRLMKFVFDGSTMEARFGNCDPILEWSAVGGGVDVRYSRGAGQAYVMRLEGKAMAGIGPEFDWLVGGVKSVAALDASERGRLLEMSDIVRETVRNKLNDTRGVNEYKKVRGDLGEGIVRTILKEMRMELLYDHPWSDRANSSESSREGPDMLVRLLDSDLVIYLEVKWWEDVTRALMEARNQVARYFQRSRVTRGQLVTGAYIAVIDWKLTKQATMLVEKVV